MAKVYLVASGKGGVGKTTVCANLGIVYANAGYKVALIDADIGLNNLDVTLGIEHLVTYDLIDVLEGKVKLNEALFKVSEYHNLMLLPSGRLNVSERINAQRFRALVEEVASICDVVFIDAPAGIERGFHRAANAADEAIIVTTPHVSAIKDADRAIGLLSTYSLKGIGIVVNRVRRDLVNRGEVLDAESIGELLRCPVYGVIPENDKLGVYATVDRYHHDKAYYCFDSLRQNVSLQQGVSFKKEKGFFRRLFR